MTKTQLILTVALFLTVTTVASAQDNQQPSKTRVKLSQAQTVASAKEGNQSNRPLPVKPAVFNSEWMVPASDLRFNELPYSYDALETAIDAKTVELHYDKHHRGYYNNFMNAIKGTDLEKIPITRIFSTITSQSDAIRNNAGGFFNHVLYWQNMSPDGGGQPSGELAQAINSAFGNYQIFTEKLSEAAKSRFGSGWAWLAIDLNTGELFITSTANQDNPLMNNVERRGVPILALDVWEHAYYLKYQNKRADYITAFWTKVNWPDIEAKYKGYKQMLEELKK